MLEKDLLALRDDNKLQRTRITTLEKELVAAGTPAAGSDWTVYIVGGVLVVLLGAGIAVALGMRNPSAGTHDAEDDAVSPDESSEKKLPPPTDSEESNDPSE